MPKEKKSNQPVFKAILKLTRISTDNVRYRVVEPGGLSWPVSHIEFSREGFPVDEDFNMDFLLKDLGRDAPRGVIKKQQAYRGLLRFELTVK